MKKVFNLLIIAALILTTFSACKVPPEVSDEDIKSSMTTAEKPTLLSDNNKECSYDGYKNTSCLTFTYKISVSYPSNWNELCIQASDEFDWQHTGIQLFNGQLPEQPEILDGDIYIYEVSNGFANTAEYENFEVESFTTANGYSVEIYYNKDNLPVFIAFDGYPSLCIFLDANCNCEISTIVKIINSIDIKLI